jgi:S-(hydroxymethyl)mycothiol dehydrogenase
MEREREGLAAILTAPGEPVTVEAITLDPPGPNEVQVRLAASGVCHTDLHIKNTGGMGMAYPILLGHEGAGYIEAVGEGVTHLAPGDPVVIAYRAPCEQCPACRRGDPRRCWVALRPKQRLHRQRDGALLSQVLRCGTFATSTIVHAKAAIKMPPEMPLDKACLIACGVVTGVGAALNTSPVWAGARVAVIGCGGVGLSVIQGARLAHARQIIGVDLSPTKLAWARDFGATDVVNASEGDPVARVRELAGGEGVDFAYEAVGLPQCIDQAVRMLAYAGTATHIGLPAPGANVTLDLSDFDTGFYWNKASLRVCHCGDALPSHDFPLLAQLYLQGKLDLDRMVTRTIGLHDVEDAFHLMESGDVIRSVMLFE